MFFPHATRNTWGHGAQPLGTHLKKLIVHYSAHAPYDAATGAFSIHTLPDTAHAE